MNSNVQEKWWGWGAENKQFDLQSRTRFWCFLKRYFDIPNGPVLPVPKIDDFQVPKSKLNSDQLQTLQNILGIDFVSVVTRDRVSHSLGKSYHDLIRLRHKKITSFPDAVCFPHDQNHVLKLLLWCKENRCNIVPYGGGTSVVGGVESQITKNERPIICIDLKRMNQIINLDEESLVVTVDAGITGPDLEHTLREQGLTLGHSPESFEFSTVGGWIAARSAGQFSTYYGSMKDMVESICLATPKGVLKTSATPASATGPDLNQFILGSEGVFGIITQARLRLHHVPAVTAHQAYLFRSFDDGIRLANKLMTTGNSVPLYFRLSDYQETNFAFALAKYPQNKLTEKIITFFFHWIRWRGFLSSKRSLLLLGYSGQHFTVKGAQKQLQSLISAYKPASLGKWTAQVWYQHRYDNPYLRDQLMDYGLLVDTLETSTEWKNVLSLYSTVKNAIEKSLGKMKIPGVVMAHLSHLYRHGSSLYFIIIAQPDLGKELEQWQQMKNDASDAIIKNGGTISHHHGVGLDHKKWFGMQLDDISLGLLRQIKAYLDPDGILNPGKLIPD